MVREYSFEIEQVLVQYNPEELLKWRQGDPSIVPADVLNWQGPGREHGYGYAEDLVKRTLEGANLEVIANKFNLFSVKKSKFESNNKLIAEALGIEKYSHLQKALGIIKNYKLKIEMPDICVLRPDFHFIEVKRDTDKLRSSQIMFAAVISAALNINFKVYKVLPIGTAWDTLTLSIKQELPDEVFLL